VRGLHAEALGFVFADELNQSLQRQLSSLRHVVKGLACEGRGGVAGNRAQAVEIADGLELFGAAGVRVKQDIDGRGGTDGAGQKQRENGSYEERAGAVTHDELP
jgi:hypothetical protein